jgi:hypothetical protein
MNCSHTSLFFAHRHKQEATVHLIIAVTLQSLRTISIFHQRNHGVVTPQSFRSGHPSKCRDDARQQKKPSCQKISLCQRHRPRRPRCFCSNARAAHGVANTISFLCYFGTLLGRQTFLFYCRFDPRSVLGVHSIRGQDYRQGNCRGRRSSSRSAA